MPETSDLAGMVPVLRRHAYLFTGSRPRADEAVETCLRSLSKLERSRGVDTLTLFRRLHEVLETQAAPDAVAVLVPRRLAAFLAQPTTRRKLLLLVALEHLPVSDAATVAGLDPATAAAELAAARAALAPVAA